MQSCNKTHFFILTSLLKTSWVKSSPPHLPIPHTQYWSSTMFHRTLKTNLVLALLCCLCAARLCFVPQTKKLLLLKFFTVQRGERRVLVLGEGQKKTKRGATWTHYHDPSCILGLSATGDVWLLLMTAFVLFVMIALRQLRRPSRPPQRTSIGPRSPAPPFMRVCGGDRRAALCSGFHLSTDGESSGMEGAVYCLFIYSFIFSFSPLDAFACLVVWHKRCGNNLQIHTHTHTIIKSIVSLTTTCCKLESNTSRLLALVRCVFFCLLAPK